MDYHSKYKVGEFVEIVSYKRPDGFIEKTSYRAKI